VKRDKTLQQLEAETTRIQEQLAQAISLGNPDLARALSRQLRNLKEQIEDAGAAELAIMRQQRIASEKIQHAEHMKQAEQERKARDIREGVGLTDVEIVMKEIDNAELNCPFCSDVNCGLKMRVDKDEMPWILPGSRTGNWLLRCQGSNESPHPAIPFRREFRRLYPSREITPESWKAAVEGSKPPAR